MTIKEVCEKYGISADTLRYYERVGVMPEVSRTKGGIRNFSEEDIKWVENAICMRRFNGGRKDSGSTISLQASS